MTLTTTQLRELFLISHRCLEVRNMDELAGIYDQFRHVIPFGFAIQASDHRHASPSALFNFRIPRDQVEACKDQHRAMRALPFQHSCAHSTVGVAPVRDCANPGFLFYVRANEHDKTEGSYTYFSDARGEYRFDTKILTQSLELIAPHLNAAYQRCNTSNADIQLTSREQDVLRWLRKGKSNWDIGRILDISEHTVKFHLRAVCRKLNVQNRVQIVAFAEKNNLLS